MIRSAGGQRNTKRTIDGTLKILLAIDRREKIAMRTSLATQNYSILNYRSSLRVIASPALFSSRLIDKPVKTIETKTKPTASTGSAPGPSMVSSASETKTSTIIGETIIRLMIV